LLNNRQELSWQVARLDYWRWHLILNCELTSPVEEVTFIWERPGGGIAAVLNPEEWGEVYFHVHPAYRTAELEEEMLVVAEQHLAHARKDGMRVLRVWAHQDDELRHNLFKKRGYSLSDWPEYNRHRSLDQPIPEVPVAEGYTVRALGEVDELPRRSWVSWRAFHPDSPDEDYEGWEWYHNIQRMPLYRRDLDIVAVAPNGEHAAFCTVWYDDVTRTGCFEPVGTAPEHQKLGLGKAVMTEGLKRLKRLGGVEATVAGFTEAANALYSRVMSPEYVLYQAWEKFV
jgi:mycothiol synthase